MELEWRGSARGEGRERRRKNFFGAVNLVCELCAVPNHLDSRYDCGMVAVRILSICTLDEVTVEAHVFLLSLFTSAGLCGMA